MKSIVKRKHLISELSQQTRLNLMGRTFGLPRVGCRWSLVCLSFQVLSLTFYGVEKWGEHRLPECSESLYEMGC